MWALDCPVAMRYIFQRVQLGLTAKTIPSCWSVSPPALTQRGEPDANQPNVPGSSQSSPNDCAIRILIKLAKIAAMDIHMHVTITDNCSVVMLPKYSDDEKKVREACSAQVWQLDVFTSAQQNRSLVIHSPVFGVFLHCSTSSSLMEELLPMDSSQVDALNDSYTLVASWGSTGSRRGPIFTLVSEMIAILGAELIVDFRMLLNQKFRSEEQFDFSFQIFFLCA